MDEATSSLDEETERRIYLALERELAGRTMLIVAHRLSSLGNVDRLFVLEDGGIAKAQYRRCGRVMLWQASHWINRAEPPDS